MKVPMSERQKRIFGDADYPYEGLPVVGGRSGTLAVSGNPHGPSFNAVLRIMGINGPLIGVGPLRWSSGTREYITLSVDYLRTNNIPSRQALTDACLCGDCEALRSAATDFVPIMYRGLWLAERARIRANSVPSFLVGLSVLLDTAGIGIQMPGGPDMAVVPVLRRVVPQLSVEDEVAEEAERERDEMDDDEGGDDEGGDEDHP